MSIPVDTIELFDYKVFSSDPEDIKYNKDTSVVIDTINAYSYVLAKKDRAFKEALQACDILLPDGFPIVMAARILKHKKIAKIAGADIFKFFCKKLNAEEGRCFFMGASEETLHKIKVRLNKEFPAIRAGFYSPPYKRSFSKADNNQMLKKINEFKPEVLFVGMTAPKQEKWVYQMSPYINVQAVVSIGAVFDFYATTVKRPSGFWIRLNLEWLIRFLKEPKRLWKRYLVYSPVFFIDMFLHFFKLNTAKKGKQKSQKGKKMEYV